MLQICTYNPLTASARQGCKLEEILLTLQTNHVIFLTGTKRPRTHCSPVTHSVLAGYRLRLGAMGWDGGRIDTRGKIDFCETWQIREVASPDRGGAIRIKTAKFDLLLMALYPPPMVDRATDRIYDWADKMVSGQRRRPLSPHCTYGVVAARRPLMQRTVQPCTYRNLCCTGYADDVPAWHFTDCEVALLTEQARGDVRQV